MKKIRTLVLALIISVASGSLGSAVLIPSNTYAATGSCPTTASFFGLPHWYDNLPLESTKDGVSCTVALSSPNDLWIIVLNVLNILLRLTGIVAVLFIIVGGIRYITSQGSASGIGAAKQTIVRAITGLGLSIVAVVIVTYVSSVFGRTVHPTDNYKVTYISEEQNV